MNTDNPSGLSWGQMNTRNMQICKSKMQAGIWTRNLIAGELESWRLRDFVAASK